MHDAHDPFSFLLNEIRAYDAGLRRNWPPHQRQHHLDALMADEAEQIAWGRRHLTVVHGETADEVEAELLDDLFDAWTEIARDAEWSRIGGVPDHHMSLTIAGPDAEQRLSTAAEAAVRANPGHWRVIRAAMPPLTWHLA